MNEDDPWKGLWPDMPEHKRVSMKVDLGLAISGATLEPGETRTLRDIADYCGVSHQAIARIEEKAIKKFRARLAELGFDKLEDLMPKWDTTDDDIHSRHGAKSTTPPKL